MNNERNEIYRKQVSLLKWKNMLPIRIRKPWKL